MDTANIINLPNHTSGPHNGSVSASFDERSRIHLRYHAARRRAVAGLQHDRAGKAAHGAQAGGARAWTSWKPASPSPPKAISKRWTRSAASSRGRRWRRWRAAARWTWSAPPQSLAHARRPRIHTFIATSDIHLKYKLKKSQQQVLDEAVAAVELARRHVDDVEFSAEDGARTDPDYLEKISQRGGGGGRAHGEHSGHGGLFDARRNTAR